MRHERSSGNEKSYGADRSLSVTATLEVLRDPLYRDIVDYCANEREGTTTIEEVTTHIVDKQEEDAAATDRHRAQIRLHHVHLPWLAEKGSSATTT